MCEECAYKDTEFCVICEDGNMFTTQEQKDARDWMCDLMCPCPEED